MIRFQDPIYLWLLLVIPLMWLIRQIAVKRKMSQLKKFGDPSLLKDMMENVSAVRPSVKFWILRPLIPHLFLLM